MARREAGAVPGEAGRGHDDLCARRLRELHPSSSGAPGQGTDPGDRPELREKKKRLAEVLTGFLGAGKPLG